MKLGINIHADWGNCPNLRWLLENTIIRNIRIDFPCRDTHRNPIMLAQLKDVLDLCGRMENIVLHTGYLGEMTYSDYSEYLDKLITILVNRDLESKVILELWNNLNIHKCWTRETDEFKRLLDILEPQIIKSAANAIRLSGFSFTIPCDHTWRWIDALFDHMRHYFSYITIQVYPSKMGGYIKAIDEFERRYPGLDYIIAETGMKGKSEKQYCQYRQLMYEIEKRTPDKLVFLYHLFDNIDNDYELISWVDGRLHEKKSAIYLKREYPFVALTADRPKDFYCCKKNWLRKIVCFFRGLFR